MDVQRPLDTLLVTVGVSLVLQQAALQIFGAQGDPVEAPGWLGGQIVRLRLRVAAPAAVHHPARDSPASPRWRPGSSTPRSAASIRATVQNRDLAETAGISTRNVDRITFFLGSGLAGVGGVAIALISAARTRRSARTYIIPAFLVVVVGGVGQLKGTVIAAWAVGVVTACLTDWTSGSLAQVITFVLVVVFLQRAPAGPVHRADEGRSHDDTRLDEPRRLRARSARPSGCSPSLLLLVWAPGSCSPFLARQPRQVLLLGDRRRWASAWRGAVAACS